MVWLIIYKEIKLIYIQKLIIIKVINKKYNNPKLILENIKIKLMLLKNNLILGKENLKMLMLKHKESKQNYLKLHKKKIDFLIC